MNLSLYSVDGFVVLDGEGHRVLAKYYRSNGHDVPKDQRAFEKGLWQKTRKPGGAHACPASLSTCPFTRRHAHQAM